MTTYEPDANNSNKNRRIYFRLPKKQNEDSRIRNTIMKENPISTLLGDNATLSSIILAYSREADVKLSVGDKATGA
jgi:hypothetical protein